MANVFLSYAREDTGHASTLARFLERAGYSVWWDRDTDGGSKYEREIDDALKQAEVVVVLWSSHSVGLDWVRDEAASARDTNRLVSVTLDHAEAPLGFGQFHTINFSHWKSRDEPGLDTLKGAVAAKVTRSPEPGVQPPTALPADTPKRRWSIAAVAAAIVVVAALAYDWTISRGDLF